VPSLLCALLIGSPAGGGTTPLRLAAIDTTTTPGMLRMVAVVPPALSAVPLDSGNFSVRQGIWTGHPTVKRLAHRGMQVVLVPDRAVSQPDINLELAAATELVHQLPDSIGVYTFANPAGTLLTSGRDDTMRALLDITPVQQPSALNAITTSIFVPPASTRRAYILLTTCMPNPATTDAAQLKASLAQQSPQSQQIDVLQIGKSCKPPISDIARSSGGSVAQAATTDGLPAAVDHITRELLAEYQLAFHTKSTNPHVMVAVSALNTQSRATIRLDKAPTPASHRSGDFMLLTIALILIIVIVLIVIVIELRRYRRLS
jgi:hypothetical protein